MDTLLTTPFDFPMQHAIDEVINKGHSAKQIVNVLRQDRLFPHPELLVTFIGNHDMPRFITQANGSTQKLKAAFGLLATLRGIPQLYYGDEIGMSGGDDPDDRHDFPGGFPGDQQNAFTPTDRTPRQQEIYTHLQSLLKLRRDHPALREGTLKHVEAGDDYYVFTRETTTERLLITFYKGDTPKDFSVDLTGTSIADAKSVTPIFGGSAATLNGGALSVKLSPMAVSIYQIE